MTDLYNVGDLVIVTDELIDDMPNGVDEDMKAYEGKVVKIKRVVGDKKNDNDSFGDYYNYEIEEDGGYFTWSSPMFASYADDFSRAVSSGVLVSRDGTEFIKVGSCYMSANGIEIPVSDYDKNKHKSNESADIVKIYSRQDVSNYLFEKDEIVWEEKQEEEQVAEKKEEQVIEKKEEQMVKQEEKKD